MHGEWRISFRRSFGADELADRDALMRVIYAVSIQQEEKDVVKWKLESSGAYSTKSMYRMLALRSINSERLKKL